MVNIETNLTNPTQTKLIKAIEFFSQTTNCGEFIPEERMLEVLAISSSELEEIVETMRALRYDIRTWLSHPIIGKGKIICTYPFPLLSPKALVESKVKFTNTEEYSI